MRKYVLAAVAAAFIVIVSPAPGRSNPGHENSIATTGTVESVVGAGGLRDEAAMVLIGSGLLILAAAVRRAV